MTENPVWINKVNEAIYAARFEALEQLRKIILEKQEWEEEKLKEHYGKGWTVMVKCPPGSGYEICDDLLQVIDDIEREDTVILGSISIFDNAMVESINEAVLRNALKDQVMKLLHDQRKENEP